MSKLELVQRAFGARKSLLRAPDEPDAAFLPDRGYSEALIVSLLSGGAPAFVRQVVDETPARLEPAVTTPLTQGGTPPPPGFPAVIDLGAFSPVDGFKIQGDADFDGTGRSVASAGDVNGDGFADLIVGADGNSSGGSQAGAAYVIFGKASGFGLVDLGTPLAATDGFKIEGADFDRAGRSVASAGDVNGDGFADLIVGAESNSSGGSGAGAAYVIFGKASGFGLVDLDTPLAATAGFKIQGADFDSAGGSVASAGDVNGDGFADLIVGADTSGGSGAGAAYVIFGKASGFGLVDLDSPLAPADGFRIRGERSFDRAGYSVASAGDVNGDGFDDLIVGATGNDSGGSEAGAAHVILGRAGERFDVNLGFFFSARDGFKIQGDAAFDRAGVSVASAGDVNGDGFADLIVGADRNDSGGSEAGAAYVIFGKAAGEFGQFDDIDLGTPLAATDGFKIQGDANFDGAGSSVASAGDVNGDGFADLIVGAYRNSSGGSQAGAAYVIFGRPSNFAPVIGSNGGDATAAISVAENGTGVTIVAATDANAGTTLAYSISGGADATSFIIDASTGVLAFLAAPDFEMPADTGADNVYDVLVRASDGTLFDEQALAVTVTGANEGISVPVDADAADNRVDENAASGTLTGVTARATDPDAGTTVSYSLTGNAGGRFAINATTGVVSVANGLPLDFETSASHVITVRAASDDGSIADRDFTISVGDVAETQVFIGAAAADVFVAPTNDNWTVDARGGNDSVTTQGGRDTIFAGAGNDTISSGGGNDIVTFIGGISANGFDAIDGGSGFDELRALANNTVISVSRISGIETINANGFGNVSVAGSNVADMLDFSGVMLSGIEYIDARGGDDDVTGSAGNDIFLLGAGNDSFDGGEGDDTFIARLLNGRDTVEGGEGTDVIVAGEASTRIQLAAFSGIEEISAGGFAGVTINGSVAAETLNFTGVTLTGIAAINGAGGKDVITGSASADTIIGGGGGDTLTGGGGADVFAYLAVLDSPRGLNADVITDFVSGQDVIDLSGVDAIGDIVGDQAFTFIGTDAFTGLGQLRIGVDGNGNTALFGNISGNLTADFQISFLGAPAMLPTDVWL